ncbi:MAG: hypothetical protein WAV27_19240 [Xanthobacteraceae bacterium]
MSVPISDRMTCALSVLMPGIEVRSSTPARKGARLASTSRSISVIGDRRIEGIDLLEVEVKHKTVVAPDPSG